MTRKLRRRPNDPVPEKVEKRRKPPPAQLNYLLDEKEIESDLKAISRGKILTTIRKPGIILQVFVSYYAVFFFLFLNKFSRIFKNFCSSTSALQYCEYTISTYFAV